MHADGRPLIRFVNLVDLFDFRLMLRDCYDTDCNSDACIVIDDRNSVTDWQSLTLTADDLPVVAYGDQDRARPRLVFFAEEC